MKLSNGEIFNYSKCELMTEFSKCTFLFRNNEPVNYLRCSLKDENILGFVMTELNDKTDLIIKIPDQFNCYHYYKGRVTNQIVSSPDSHLTYHGTTKGKKETGEIHLDVDGSNPLKGRSNVLAAPLASSDNLSKFPLPICRFELTECINAISLNRNIDNYFETFEERCFFNTLDVYLAKKGFTENFLRGTLRIPEIVLSLFAYTNLEGFKTGKLIRRTGHYPQVIVLQSKEHEVIIINIHEYRNTTYLKNSLYYFHSVNYIEKLFNRYAKEAGPGYFVDLFDNYAQKGPGFFNIQDII